MNWDGAFGFLAVASALSAFATLIMADVRDWSRNPAGWFLLALSIVSGFVAILLGGQA